MDPGYLSCNHELRVNHGEYPLGREGQEGESSLWCHIGVHDITENHIETAQQTKQQNMLNR